jgi:hypothetical protein
MISVDFMIYLLGNDDMNTSSVILHAYNIYDKRAASGVNQLLLMKHLSKHLFDIICNH